MENTSVPEPVRRTWMPTTAGILTIIVGGVNIIIGIVAISLSGTIASMYRWWDTGGWSMGMMPHWIAIAGVPMIIIGIISVIGGSFSLKRKAWGMVLAGAILAPGGLLW